MCVCVCFFDVWVPARLHFGVCRCGSLFVSVGVGFVACVCVCVCVLRVGIFLCVYVSVWFAVCFGVGLGRLSVKASAFVCVGLRLLVAIFGVRVWVSLCVRVCGGMCTCTCVLVRVVAFWGGVVLILSALGFCRFRCVG